MSGPNFTSQFEIAVAHILDPHTSQDTDGILAGSATDLVNRPDHFINGEVYVQHPAQVVTPRPGDYRELVLAAMESIRPHRFGDLQMSPAEEDYITGVVVRHELLHGEVVSQRGNQQTEALYGIRLMRAADGLSITPLPFQSTNGPLRKVHTAESAAAPHERKRHDMRIVALLGYDPNDLDTLRRIADATPNVPEGWHPAYEEDERELLAIAKLARQTARLR